MMTKNLFRPWMSGLFAPRRWFTRLLGVVLIAGGASAGHARAVSVERTTTNGRANPLGIGSEDISLAWVVESELRGTVQSAYQVRVGTAPDAADVWDSGRVTSDRQVDIALPASVALRPGTRYFWQVRVWDGTGTASEWSKPAWFETGLRSADWDGARWITHRPPSAPAGTDAREGSRPLFRKVVTLTKPVKSARLHATAHGIYQLSLNGEKVGDQSLAPGWTDYARRLQTQTYDIHWHSLPGFT
jgi:alpha-L-rhamnosidase